MGIQVRQTAIKTPQNAMFTLRRSPREVLHFQSFFSFSVRLSVGVTLCQPYLIIRSLLNAGAKQTVSKSLFLRLFAHSVTANRFTTNNKSGINFRMVECSYAIKYWKVSFSWGVVWNWFEKNILVRVKSHRKNWPSFINGGVFCLLSRAAAQVVMPNVLISWLEIKSNYCIQWT